MKQHRKVFKTLGGMLDLSAQPMPGVPIIEMAGNRRVLIENHQGVMEYGNERISIVVKFGKVVITGTGMEMCYMSKHQLIITGCIDGVSIERG